MAIQRKGGGLHALSSRCDLFITVNQSFVIEGAFGAIRIAFHALFNDDAPSVGSLDGGPDIGAGDARYPSKLRPALC